MQQITRDNHYVPQWYQRGFMAKGKHKLHVSLCCSQPLKACNRIDFCASPLDVSFSHQPLHCTAWLPTPSELPPVDGSERTASRTKGGTAAGTLDRPVGRATTRYDSRRHKQTGNQTKISHVTLLDASLIPRRSSG